MLALLRLIRPKQWVKNAFVLAPLFFTPGAVTQKHVIAVLLGTLCFCALSSVVYIVNDYMDREADRLHPEKRFRPLAAGTVTTAQAFTMLAGLLGMALAIGSVLPQSFGIIAACYLVLNLLYSLKLKHVSIVDVMLVAFCYVLRVLAGAGLAEVPPSVWIISCTLLVSLFIALAKRRDDIAKRMDAEHRGALRGYTKEFLDTSIAIVLASLLVSYLIYTTSPDVMHRAGTDKLYVTTPFVIMGVLRYLQIAQVEEKSGSPTKVVMSDRFLILCVLGWIIVYGALLYG